MNSGEFESFFKPIKTLMSLRSSPNEGMQAVIDLAKIFGVERICIFLKDMDDQMILACGHPADKHGIKNKKELREHPALQQTMEKKKMLLIKTPNQDSRVACTPQFCEIYQINASLFIRLEINKKPIGVIVIDAVGEKKKFTKDDIKMAKEIALLATKEIHNRQRIENAARQRTMWLVAAALAHEIRNPITAIGGFALRLHKENPTEASKIILTESQRLESLLKEIIDSLKSTNLNLQKTNLNRFVSALLENEQKNHIEIKFEPEKIPQVPLDEKALKIALIQFLKNAKDAIGQQEGKKIIVKTYKKPHFVYMEIINTGSYIEPNDQERIFTPFYTKSKKSNGLGLGLTIAKDIIEGHGGTIQVESRKEPEQQTSFICAFPVKKQRN